MGHGKKPEGEAGEIRKGRSFRGEFITFLILFFILWLFSYILTLRFPGFLVSAGNFIASEIAWLLSILSYSHTLKDSTLTLFTAHGGERLVVIAECTGIYTTIIYLSIVGSYPARISEKLAGLLIGIPAIHILNLIRMVFVALVLYHKRELFEFFHGYLWQGSFLIFMLVLVVFWMTKIVKPRRAPDANGPAEDGSP
ncbi:MAG: hypothetical protein JW814_04460 [Candidatus Krumholzibacteriota bacterium]|nr:hypothetical protein [Candidatus Krumholzibacteriota bacterium]